jgi:alcohol dehydrogenase
MSMFPTIGSSERLTDRVAAEIQKLISQQHLVPGMKLPSERELGEQFGVSRTVVREAVRMLVSKGMLETRRGKGTQVCRMTSDQISGPLSMLMATETDRFSIEHIHQVRSILEVAAVRLAARQATGDDLAELQRLVESMGQVDAHGEVFAARDADFHIVLARTTHNPLMVVLLEAIRDVMRDIRRSVRVYKDLGAIVIADHRKIVDCIAARDEDGAAQAMLQHLEHARRIQQQLLEVPATQKERQSSSEFQTAYQLIREFKGETYTHGFGVLSRVGAATGALGKRALLVRDSFPEADDHVAAIRASLSESGVAVCAEIKGAAPNAPREDLARIAASAKEHGPEVVVSFGGGSTIDAAKAAIVLARLGGNIDEYFGTGQVSKKLAESGTHLIPHVAVQTAAGSAAHLTKYANITDLSTGQKKLVVDEAIVPARPIFDYAVTAGAPASLTADGAFDGFSHALEVLYSAVGKPNHGAVERVALECIRLVVKYLPRALAEPRSEEAREALGLATDLGGYAIMLGGTNGAHLASFSLVDILSHGRACGLLNPYYTVLFAPAVQDSLRKVGSIYRAAGYMTVDPAGLGGRELGLAVAQGMIAFEKAVGFPATLGEVAGFADGHITRALAAAKDPQLKMKLENMPVPLTAGMVDEFMGPVLQAAKTGDLGLIRNVE